MIDSRLRGKVVLVTGGNNPLGIGAATARAFATQGAAVLVHGYPSTTGGTPLDPLPSEAGEAQYLALQRRDAAAVVADIRAAGGRAEAIDADLGDPDVAVSLFDRAESLLGPVDVLVNNAAHCEQDTLLPASAIGRNDRAVDAFPLHPLTAAGFDRHLAVNARAPALLMTELARRLLARRAGWGRIVNVSTDGARCFPTEVSYGSSKHALESLSRAAAHELGPYGITVNVVSLGPIQTGWISPELEASLAASTPLRRIGHPDDVADAIVFLASHQARWITGQVLHVGGGHTI